MIRSKGILSRIFTKSVMKGTAMLLVVSMVVEIFIPTTAKALTSGPTQPEVQSFSPIGTSDMVNIFTGDFSYNIPLLDVDGYPINISYSSGIAMDDEASWVGLGWNINAGVINRNMRGLPDEFNGDADAITKETNMKPNRTFGLSGGLDFELFGKKLPKLTNGSSDTGSISLKFKPKLGFNYNNYRGMGTELSASINLSVSVPGVGKFGSGLGLTSSSESGLTIAPSLSFDRKYGKDASQSEDKGAGTLKCNVGTSINSRSGMKQLSVNVSNSFVKDNTKTKTDEAGNTTTTGKKRNYSGSGAAKFSFGQSTYTPVAGPNMKNLSVTGNFKTGIAFYGTHPALNISGYYSQQKLAETTVTNPAYGYMNHEQGQGSSNALFDFNRENDGSYTQQTPAIALPQQTFDMYNVSGQGVGGSYRIVRSDYSYVYDPQSTTSSDGYDIGVELGVGATNHNGGDLTVTANNTTTGMWDSENYAKSNLKATNGTSTKGYEKFYFKEASEKTIDGDEFYNTYGDKHAARIELLDHGDFNVVAGTRLQMTTGGFVNLPSVNTRSKREKRNQVMLALTKYEVLNDGGLESLLTGSYAQASAPNHHIAEITTYSNDGSRYVYGLPAYNTTQKDITFAVGATLNDNDGAVGNCGTGLVPYNTDDNSLSNARGIDNYYSATTTPAYAHSYLLTAMLSPDYIDSDSIKGPSDKDMGYYTKFYYEKISGYKWRTPYTSANYAAYNEGIKTDSNDDKANIIYGEKELYYMDSIVTKNYIAIFHKSDRNDGTEAYDVNGGQGSKHTKRLDKISLYSRWDYRRDPANAVPLKEVHFVYDYSLCDGVPNNSAGGGKLTLKEIYFTYQNSQKAKFSSYKFEYNGLNPDYAFKANDRWGNYKPMPPSPGCGSSGDLSPAEFPYVLQNKDSADAYVSAWHVTDIKLPSGGKIHVDYESDDYAYVQNKKATQMFKIAGYEGQTFPVSENDATNITDDDKKIYFNLQDGVTDIKKYIGDYSRVYFRFLMETNSGHHDYVSGYFNIASYGTEVVSGTLYGYVIPQAVDINDAAASDDVNPITKATTQYCRLNLPRFIYDQPAIDDGDSFGLEVLNSLVSVVSNFSQAAQGENKWLLTKGKCEDAILKKSWMRLYNPTGKKLGGGLRVKKIEMTDEWEDMTDSEMTTANYGQEYSYDLEDGTSSGVAAYEPQLGGDENVFKQPIFTNEKNLLAPDNEHYTEEPFGESFFPAASVGYSRVTVKNLTREGVTKHATGKVVHEFYTAKDFPTIVEYTKIKPIQDKTDPFSIASMFYVRSKDFMTVSQGFYIEVNDMHGKPKKESVYQESKDIDPITSVEYKYKSESYLNGSLRLNNKMQVIQPNGTVSEKNIGLVMDMVTDFREQRNVLNSAATMIQLDGFIWPFPPTYIPFTMGLPSLTHQVTQFRSAATTKLVQRFGILEETIAKDLGSVVSTKNIAYDSETGEVLLTQTKTDYNDAIYTMSYPAHWYYDNMGQAYKNIGLTNAAVTFTSGTATISNADQYFTPGDVLQLKTAGSVFLTGWVTSVTNNSISVVKKDGGTFGGSYSFKIIRSGRRNLQSTPIATITSLSNPLTNFNGNVYDKVLQASAVEFSDRWRTFCDCFDNTSAHAALPNTTNPYILGTRGNWRMKTSFLHLSPRTQSLYNNNTNTRKDGVFMSFTPYYRLNTGKWQVDEKNWTFTSTLTEVSPYGQELENQDALGRYSAATFGYRQAFATGVAANARYRDIGFDNFEDYGFSNCADNHFKFPIDTTVIDYDAHSGRRSMKISAGSKLRMQKPLVICSAEGCTVNVTGNAISPTIMDIDVTGGQEPYQIDYNVVHGNPSISFSGTSFNTLIATGSAYSVEVIVLDAQGCKITKTINH